MMPLVDDLLHKGLTLFPEKKALFFENQHYGYADLDKLSSYIAQQLQKAAIQPGDRVALYMANCPELVLSYLALLKMGAVAVPINFSFKGDRLHFLLENSGAKAIILDAPRMNALQPLLPALPALRQHYVITKNAAAPFMDFSQLLAPIEIPASFPVVNPHDVAMIFYTSGTMGVPKGVMYSQQALHHAMLNQATAQQMDEQDHSLIFLLMTYVAGFLGQLLPTLFAGGQMTLLTAFDANQSIAAFVHHTITRLMCVPSQLAALLEHPSVNNINFTRLRSCIVGGEAMPLSTARAFQKTSGILPAATCGMTESFSYLLDGPFDHIRAGSAGRPVPGAEIKIAAPKGQQGEAFIKSPANMLGYWHNEKATQKVLSADGWLATGDIFLEDKDGYFWYIDRKEQMITLPEGEVSPSATEQALLSHPAIREAGVVGKVNLQHNIEICAYLVPKAGATLPDAKSLQLFLTQNCHLQAWQLPRHIFILDTLPHTVSGKIDRKMLTKIAGEQTENTRKLF